MSVLRHTLEKVTGGETASGPSYQAQYLVTVSSPHDHTYTVINGMPWQIGDEFSIGNDYDPRAIALTATADPVSKNNYRWTYNVEFGVPDEEQQVQNPFSEPPEIELTFAHRERPLERDINGKWIRNTLGERFDDFVMKEDSQPILKISRNEPLSEALFGVDLRDTINRTRWNGAARRTVKFQPPTLRSRYHSVLGAYYEKGYEFKFSDETWRFILLNQGYNTVSESGGLNTGEPLNKSLIKIKDKDGKDISAPLALTQEGQVLAPDDNPVWLEFDGYRESQFPNWTLPF